MATVYTFFVLILSFLGQFLKGGAINIVTIERLLYKRTQHRTKIKLGVGRLMSSEGSGVRATKYGHCLRTVGCVPLTLAFFARFSTLAD